MGVAAGIETRAGVGAADAFSEATRLLVPGQGGRQWYVFHTRPRREKKAAGALDEMDLRHYLPLREKVTRKGRGRYRFRIPLFPGYLFACCNGGERMRAMQSGHMVRWLEVVNQQQLLDELTDIYVACQRGTGLRLYPQLQRGRWVRVVNGPLAGVRGRISKRKERYRVVLDLTALGTAVALEVDMQDVEALARGQVDEEESVEHGAQDSES